MLISTLHLLPVNIVQILSIFVYVLGMVILRGEKRYNGLMVAFLLSAVSMVFNLFEELGATGEIILITPSFTLTVGPSLYLFIRVLIRPERPLAWRDCRHGLPALISLLFTQHFMWVLAAGALSQLIYLGISLHVLMRYKRAINERRSDPDRLDLNWLFNLFFLLVVLIVVEIIRVNLQPVLPYSLKNHWYLIDQVIFLFLITGFLVGLIRQPEIFTGLTEFEQTDLPAQNTDNDQAHSIFKEIDGIVKTRQLFRTPRLSLQDIADQTGLLTKDISWAINQGGKVSFADYINSLRLQQVIDDVKSKTSSTLLDIALDAGFSSKSSFNAVFKKQLGMSPTQYLKRPES